MTPVKSSNAHAASVLSPPQRAAAPTAFPPSTTTAGTTSHSILNSPPSLVTPYLTLRQLRLTLQEEQLKKRQQQLDELRQAQAELNSLTSATGIEPSQTSDLNQQDADVQSRIHEQTNFETVDHTSQSNSIVHTDPFTVIRAASSTATSPGASFHASANSDVGDSLATNRHQHQPGQRHDSSGSPSQFQIESRPLIIPQTRHASQSTLHKRRREEDEELEGEEYRSSSVDYDASNNVNNNITSIPRDVSVPSPAITSSAASTTSAEALAVTLIDPQTLTQSVTEVMKEKFESLFAALRRYGQQRIDVATAGIEQELRSRSVSKTRGEGASNHTPQRVRRGRSRGQKSLHDISAITANSAAYPSSSSISQSHYSTPLKRVPSTRGASGQRTPSSVSAAHVAFGRSFNPTPQKSNSRAASVDRAPHTTPRRKYANNNEDDADMDEDDNSIEARLARFRANAAAAVSVPASEPRRRTRSNQPASRRDARFASPSGGSSSSSAFSLSSPSGPPAPPSSALKKHIHRPLHSVSMMHSSRNDDFYILSRVRMQEKLERMEALRRRVELEREEALLSSSDKPKKRRGRSSQPFSPRSPQPSSSSSMYSSSPPAPAPAFGSFVGLSRTPPRTPNPRSPNPPQTTHTSSAATSAPAFRQPHFSSPFPPSSVRAESSESSVVALSPSQWLSRLETMEREIEELSRWNREEIQREQESATKPSRKSLRDRAILLSSSEQKEGNESTLPPADTQANNDSENMQRLQSRLDKLEQKKQWILQQRKEILMSQSTPADPANSSQSPEVVPRAIAREQLLSPSRAAVALQDSEPAGSEISIESALNSPISNEPVVEADGASSQPQDTPASSSEPAAPRLTIELPPKSSSTLSIMASTSFKKSPSSAFRDLSHSPIAVPLPIEAEPTWKRISCEDQEIVSHPVYPGIRMTSESPTRESANVIQVLTAHNPVALLNVSSTEEKLIRPAVSDEELSIDPVIGSRSPKSSGDDNEIVFRIPTDSLSSHTSQHRNDRRHRTPITAVKIARADNATQEASEAVADKDQSGKATVNAQFVTDNDEGAKHDLTHSKASNGADAHSTRPLPRKGATQRTLTHEEAPLFKHTLTLASQHEEEQEAMEKEDIEKAKILVTDGEQGEGEVPPASIQPTSEYPESASSFPSTTGYSMQYNVAAPMMDQDGAIAAQLEKSLTESDVSSSVSSANVSPRKITSKQHLQSLALSLRESKAAHEASSQALAEERERIIQLQKEHEQQRQTLEDESARQKQELSEKFESLALEKASLSSELDRLRQDRGEAEKALTERHDSLLASLSTSFQSKLATHEEALLQSIQRESEALKQQQAAHEKHMAAERLDAQQKEAAMMRAVQDKEASLEAERSSMRDVQQQERKEIEALHERQMIAVKQEKAEFLALQQELSRQAAEAAHEAEKRIAMQQKALEQQLQALQDATHLNTSSSAAQSSQLREALATLEQHEVATREGSNKAAAEHALRVQELESTMTARAAQISADRAKAMEELDEAHRDSAARIAADRAALEKEREAIRNQAREQAELNRAATDTERERMSQLQQQLQHDREAFEQLREQLRVQSADLAKKEAEHTARFAEESSNALARLAKEQQEQQATLAAERERILKLEQQKQQQLEEEMSRIHTLEQTKKRELAEESQRLELLAETKRQQLQAESLAIQQSSTASLLALETARKEWEDQQRVAAARLSAESVKLHQLESERREALSNDEKRLLEKSAALKEAMAAERASLDEQVRNLESAKLGVSLEKSRLEQLQHESASAKATALATLSEKEKELRIQHEQMVEQERERLRRYEESQQAFIAQERKALAERRAAVEAESAQAALDAEKRFAEKEAIIESTRQQAEQELARVRKLQTDQAAEVETKRRELELELARVRADASTKQLKDEKEFQAQRADAQAKLEAEMAQVRVRLEKEYETRLASLAACEREATEKAIEAERVKRLAEDKLQEENARVSAEREALVHSQQAQQALIESSRLQMQQEIIRKNEEMEAERQALAREKEAIEVEREELRASLERREQEENEFETQRQALLEEVERLRSETQSVVSDTESTKSGKAAGKYGSRAAIPTLAQRRAYAASLSSTHSLNRGKAWLSSSPRPAQFLVVSPSDKSASPASSKTSTHDEVAQMSTEQKQARLEELAAKKKMWQEKQAAFDAAKRERDAKELKDKEEAEKSIKLQKEQKWKLMVENAGPHGTSPLKDAKAGTTPRKSGIRPPKQHSPSTSLTASLPDVSEDAPQSSSHPTADTLEVERTVHSSSGVPSSTASIASSPNSSTDLTSSHIPFPLPVALSDVLSSPHSVERSTSPASSSMFSRATDTTPEPLHAVGKGHAKPPPHKNGRSSLVAHEGLLLAMEAQQPQSKFSGKTTVAVTSPSSVSQTAPMPRRKLTAHSMDSDDDNAMVRPVLVPPALDPGLIGATDEENGITFPTEAEMQALFESAGVPLNEKDFEQVDKILSTASNSASVSTIASPEKPKGLVVNSRSPSATLPNSALSSPRSKLGRLGSLDVTSDEPPVEEELLTARAKRREMLRRKSRNKSAVIGKVQADGIRSSATLSPSSKNTSAFQTRSGTEEVDEDEASENKINAVSVTEKPLSTSELKLLYVPSNLTSAASVSNSMPSADDPPSVPSSATSFAQPSPDSLKSVFEDVFAAFPDETPAAAVAPAATVPHAKVAETREAAVIASAPAQVSSSSSKPLSVSTTATSTVTTVSSGNSSAQASPSLPSRTPVRPSPSNAPPQISAPVNTVKMYSMLARQSRENSIIKAASRASSASSTATSSPVASPRESISRRTSGEDRFDPAAIAKNSSSGVSSSTLLPIREPFGDDAAASAVGAFDLDALSEPNAVAALTKNIGSPPRQIDPFGDSSSHVATIPSLTPPQGGRKMVPPSLLQKPATKPTNPAPSSIPARIAAPVANPASSSTTPNNTACGECQRLHRKSQGESHSKISMPHSKSCKLTK